MSAPARVIPAAWLVPAQIRRIICHWTAGAYAVSEPDRKHYHVILQDLKAQKVGDDVRAVRGIWTPRDNDNTADDRYAAHTKGANSNSFGLAVACMADAREGGPYGRYPLTELLVERMAQACAEIIVAYGLVEEFEAHPEQVVMQHGEVGRILNKPQAGKWDVLEWPFEPNWSREDVCDTFRRKIQQWYLPRVR